MKRPLASLALAALLFAAAPLPAEEPPHLGIRPHCGECIQIGSVERPQHQPLGAQRRYLECIAHAP